MCAQPQQRGAPGVGEPEHGQPLREPLESADRVAPGGQAPTRRGQPGDGRRIVEPGTVGHPSGGLPVEDLGVDVRAASLPDAPLLEFDMPLPHREQLLDGRVVGGGHRVANLRSKPAGFVDQRAEDVEDDDLDVEGFGHECSRSHCRHRFNR